MGLDIAYLSTEYPPMIYGGLGVYVESISREIAAMGNRISVFAPGGPGLKRRESRRGVTVFRMDAVSMRESLEIFLSGATLAWGDGLSLLMDLFSYNQLAAAKLLSEGPYDLCVSHDWLGLPGGMAVRQHLPLVYHVHGTEVGRSERPNPQLVELEVKGARMADMVLTVSEAMAGELVGLGVPREKIRVCYHGVDARRFDPSSVDAERLAGLRDRYGLAGDEEVILFLGRLEPVKGVPQLLAALPLIREKHPHARLVLVGRGTLQDRVRQDAERYGGITVVDDFLTVEDKVLHYALADLCVFPSIYEPFGIVALEAAAMQRPAVVGASGVSGLREIVENPSSERPTGVHVNARDPSDIAWGVNTALEDPERLKEWGKNARARVLERFTWRSAAEETLKHYQEAISSRS